MWEPLINDNFKKKIISDKLIEISKVLEKDSSEQSPGLFVGKSGLSLFFSYLNKLKRGNNYNATVHSLLSGAFDSINNGNTDPTFSYGISGILWTLHHLNVEGFIEEEDYYEELVQYLAEHMILYAKKDFFDYLHGANGIGLYLLQFPNLVDDSNLKELIKLLESSGLKERDSIKWESIIHLDSAKKAFNLSLSHGISSIIVFLSKIIEIMQEKEILHAKDLLNKSVNYLLSTKHNPSKKLQSLYPGFIDNSGIDDESRLAWCYGDLGIAVAFYRAGIVLKRQDLIDESINIMLHASSRRDPRLQKVFDAGFCHGASGVAHIFNRFYQNTKKQEFKDAALYWLDETLNMASFSDGAAGFKKFEQKKWQNSMGLLEGISGIGLVLISSISDIEPKWDQSLLLS